MSGSEIAKNLMTARQIIDSARVVSGIDDVVLVGVTKTRTVDQICDLIQAGCVDIGENRVQEWEEKSEDVEDELKRRGFDGQIRRHLVGHLQSNKAKRSLTLFDMIQSLDSLKLAERLSRLSVEENTAIMHCLIQVKLGEEETKSGMDKTQLESDFEKIIDLPGIRVVGLMLIAPLWAMGEEARPYYNEMFELYSGYGEQVDSRFEMKHLSMGMSADFNVAIQEGANIVRIGRALFEGFENI